MSRDFNINEVEMPYLKKSGSSNKILSMGNSGSSNKIRSFYFGKNDIQPRSASAVVHYRDCKIA